MPGGGPQGTILGMFLFLVLINDAGFKNESESLGVKITQAFNKRTELNTRHWKYVDDLTVAEAINLKRSLTSDDENTLQKPLSYHNRTQQVLPEGASQVQKQLTELSEYAKENEMRVNKRKTKVMLFNTARKHVFTPALQISEEMLEVSEEMKLLGVKITNDLKWNSNTQYITNKAYSRLWMIRRLKKLGANSKELVDCYTKQARSVLEYCSVVWHPGLSEINRLDIERVQKTVWAIILGKKYTSYQAALATLGLERLDSRRDSLSLKFAKKAVKSEKFSSWFVKDKNVQNTRRKIQTVKKAQFRTARLQKSALPYLTTILNKNKKSDI